MHLLFIHDGLYIVKPCNHVNMQKLAFISKPFCISENKKNIFLDLKWLFWVLEVVAMILSLTSS